MTMSAKRSNTRIRPMSCDRCGYHLYGTRSWWENGFPTCACGGTILPVKDADRAWCGLLGPDDMPSPMWTRICRENGWDDAIQRKGAAALAFNRRVAAEGGIMGRRAGAAHCAHPGCGRWIASGADRCTAGHLQDGSSSSVELEAMPF